MPTAPESTTPQRRRARGAESLTIHAEVQGCFSGEALDVALSIDGPSASLTWGYERGAGARGGAIATVQVPPEEARRWMSEVQQILCTPQHLSGHASTTVYLAKVEWAKGSSRSTWAFESSELPIEVALDILPALPEAKQAAARQQLAFAFNAAHELFAWCQRVVRERGDAEQRALLDLAAPAGSPLPERRA